jgi:Na+/H+ antiporter NhaC
MSDKPAANNQELKEYAGGWMTERKGTDVPGFLKLAFPIIGFFCVAYLVVYMNGEVSHSDRGSIVQQFNRATESSPGLMYAIAACALVYVVLVVAFAIRKFHEE